MKLDNMLKAVSSFIDQVIEFEKKYEDDAELGKQVRLLIRWFKK